MYSATNHVPFPQGGVLLLSSEHSEGLLSRFGPVAERENHHLIPIEFGTLNQLRNLVHLVSTGEVSCGFQHFLCDVYSVQGKKATSSMCAWLKCLIIQPKLLVGIISSVVCVSFGSHFLLNKEKTKYRDKPSI